MSTRQNLDTVEAHVTPHGEKLFVHVIKTPLYVSRSQFPVPPRFVPLVPTPSQIKVTALA